MSRVVIAVDGEVTLRAAQSLAVHPGVDEVAVLSPAENTHFATVETPDGFDLVVGTNRAAAVAAEADLPVAVTGELDDQAGVFLGSLSGLALALAVGVDDVETVAVARPGEAGGDVSLVFPSPIDSRRAKVSRVDGHELHVAGGDGPLGAAMVLGGNRHRVIVDDHAFMAGIALAGAAVVALAHPVDRAIPVWTRATDYLRAVAEMGLVIGERSAAA